MVLYNKNLPPAIICSHSSLEQAFKVFCSRIYNVIEPLLNDLGTRASFAVLHFKTKGENSFRIHNRIRGSLSHRIHSVRPSYSYPAFRSLPDIRFKLVGII